MQKWFRSNKKRVSALTLAFTMFMTLSWVTGAFADPWKFGVMADTQWISNTSAPVTDDTRAPNSTPVDIITALNRQFINQGVRLVIEVGDLCDNGSTAGEDTRALFAQALYNAGIGFFPFRGNHDSSATAANEFLRIYPQTLNGAMNSTPSNVFSASITGPNQAMPPIVGSPFLMGSNFSSPNTSNTSPNGLAASDLTGLSYSFDYNNNGAGNTVRFVLLDGQAAAGTDGTTPGIDKQQNWITTQLSSRPAGSHAFVMSHKGLITENHVDVLFGSDPSQDPGGQNTFFSSLYNNNVRYYLNGHDHMYDRSRINSPDGTSYVNQLLCASDSSKFYTPGYPLANNNDVAYNHPTRQTMLSQELHTVGYYVFTVDGPKVTVDYYSAQLPASTNLQPNNCSGSKCEYLITNTTAAATNPDFLTFAKAETFGYSLNGKEYLVPQGGSYTSVNETYNTTTAKILGGTNGSTLTDYSTRPLTKAVDTGWTDQSGSAVSNILTLWGMNDLYAANTDTYTLSLSYNPGSVTAAQLQSGLFGLATKDGKGNWVNALNKNAGGSSKFVYGPWNSGYGLGTYGVDTTTNTAWAVINHASDFAVAPFSLTDISSQVSVTSSGFLYSRATGKFSGTLTLTNTGATAISGQVAVTLNNLTTGVTLANATGTNNGFPYISSAVSLNPGASTTIPVQFTNPSNAIINFTPVTTQE